MAYQQIPVDEHDGISRSSTSGSTAFPPVYDEGGYGSASFQNYAYISIEETVVRSFNIDTDLPPPFGRFEAPEEQEKAPNLLLKAEHTQAIVNLRGSKKANIEFGINSYFRRVLEIVSELQYLRNLLKGTEPAFLSEGSSRSLNPVRLQNRCTRTERNGRRSRRL